MAKGVKQNVTNVTVLRLMRLVDEREGGSIRRFCEKTGMSQPHYQTCISRNSAPKIDTLEKVRDAYGVTTDWLLGKTESQTAPLQTAAVAAAETAAASETASPQTLDRLISLWERDKDDASKREDKLFSIVDDVNDDKEKLFSIVHTANDEKEKLFVIVNEQVNLVKEQVCIVHEQQRINGIQAETVNTLLKRA